VVPFTKGLASSACASMDCVAVGLELFGMLPFQLIAQCKAAAIIARVRALWRTHSGHDQMANAKSRPEAAFNVLILLSFFWLRE
jgi:hypothetical protein